MEPVSSRRAEILLYLKISIRWRSLFFFLPSLLPRLPSYRAGNTRCTSWDLSQQRQACNTYIMNQKTQTRARTLGEEAGAPPATSPPPHLPKLFQVTTVHSALDATPVCSEQCCNWVCSTEEDLKFKLGSFRAGQPSPVWQPQLRCVSASPEWHWLPVITMPNGWRPIFHALFSLNPCIGSMLLFSLPDCCLPPSHHSEIDDIQLQLGQLLGMQMICYFINNSLNNLNN